MKKRILFLLAILCFIFTMSSVVSANNEPIKVLLNDKLLQFDVDPFIENDRVLVPFRGIFEALGANVEWDGSTQTIFAARKDKLIVMQIGNDKILTLNEEPIILDVPPKLVNDRTFVPLRFVSQALGATVNWDEASKTVEIIDSTIEEISSQTPAIIDPNIKHPLVTIEMENGEEIKIELYPEIAPNTVYNFLSLIQKNFYDGTIFHRVIPGFMIQGGDPEGTGMGGPGYSIAGEFSSNGFKNDLKHTRGIVSMARTSIPDSAGSQFFIMVADAPHLDGEYAAFGKVIEGMEVVDKIVNVDRDQNDKPLQDQKMKTVTVELFGETYPEPEKIDNSQ